MNTIDRDTLALFIPIIAVGGGLILGAIAIFMGVLRKINKEKQMEESRREIAAYVAEGSMTPDDAERILKA